MPRWFLIRKQLYSFLQLFALSVYCNSKKEIQEIGDRLGIDWSKVDLDVFVMGLAFELEHGRRDPRTNVTDDDPLLTGKLARVHLNELPGYYTRSKKMEDE